MIRSVNWLPTLVDQTLHPEQTYDSGPAMTIAVYTCVIGGYDILMPPVQREPGVDYYVFTDDPTLKVRGWVTKPVSTASFESSVAAGRYYKIQAPVVLRGYDTSVYVDGNIRITGRLRPLLRDFWASGAAVGLMKHPLRSTVNEEAAACLSSGALEDRGVVENQLKRYASEGFPDDAGLVETGVLLRDHSQRSLGAAMQLWWEQIDQHTKRDQLSFPYVRWKTQLHTVVYDIDVRRANPYFRLHPHRSRSRLRNLKTWITAKQYDSVWCRAIFTAYKTIFNTPSVSDW